MPRSIWRLLHNILPKNHDISTCGDRQHFYISRPGVPSHRLSLRDCKPLLCLFSISAALNRATGCTYQPLWAITVMSTGRCTRIIHQQHRVKSNLSDVVVLSMFLMIDSGRDERGLQGSDSVRDVETGKYFIGWVDDNQHSHKKECHVRRFHMGCIWVGWGWHHEVVVLQTTSVLYISAKGMANGAGNVPSHWKTARPYYLQTLRWHIQPRVVPSRLWTAMPAGEWGPPQGHQCQNACRCVKRACRWAIKDCVVGWAWERRERHIVHK